LGKRFKHAISSFAASLTVTKKILKDAKGRALPYDIVWEIAYDNALHSGEGSGLALKRMIDAMDDSELLQWATDENGNFSDHLLKD